MTVQDVIKDRREEFLSKMSAKDIASTLKLYDIIPECVEYDINYSRSTEVANGRLLTVLMGQASEKLVQGIFKFASEEKDAVRNKW